MKWFVLPAGIWILIDKINLPIVQACSWKLTGYGYIQGSSGKYKNQCLHCIIAKLAGFDVTNFIDHKDRNTRNNQLSNLRPATHSQNMRNSKIHSNNTSGYPGVYWDKARQKWYAQIKVNGKQINLGRFDNLEEAIRTRKQATIKYFGEFARTEVKT